MSVVALVVGAASIAGVTPPERVRDVKTTGRNLRLPKDAPPGWAPRAWPGDARVEDAWTLGGRLFALVIGGDEADGRSALVACRHDGQRCVGIVAGPYTGLSGVVGPLGMLEFEDFSSRIVGGRVAPPVLTPYLAVVLRDGGHEFIQLCGVAPKSWRCEAEVVLEGGFAPRFDRGMLTYCCANAERQWLAHDDPGLVGFSQGPRDEKPGMDHPGCAGWQRSRFGRLTCDGSPR